MTLKPVREGPTRRPRARRRPRWPDQVIGRRASRQLGLIAYWQVIEAGLTDDHVRHRIASRRWRVVQRSVFVVNGVPDSWELRAMAACLAAGAGRKGVAVAASHGTAAVLHGLHGSEPPDRIDVLVTGNRQTAGQGRPTSAHPRVA